MTNQDQKYALVTELARAKSEQNIEAATAIYHPNAEMSAPSFGSVAKGSTEIAQQLSVFFSLFPDYEIVLEQYAINENVMLATGQASITLTGSAKTCPRIQVPVFIEFHFHENRISKEVFYLDAGLICRKSGVNPEEFFGAMRTVQTRKRSTDKKDIGEIDS